ncbi:MAG TPA: lactate permease LctP family transporter [Actinomycetota bacterium]|nr:lactate permease LctP family transporter [Actinomycetota bacterium]
MDWQQVYDPVAGSIWLSALVAAIPILVLFLLLAVLRIASHWASLAALAVAFLIAIIVYGMPVGPAFSAVLMGGAFGIFPIVWIVVNAIFIYNVTVDTGHFDTIRDSIAHLSGDRRVQAVLIAFVFGALLEAIAGFGTPVAITASLMAGLGFDAFYAAALALLANTAPVAFGGFGIPVITAASTAGLPLLEVSQMVGRQTPFLALIIPAMLVVVMAGWRRAIEVWPLLAVAGVTFAIVQFAVSNFIGPEVTDILASVITVIALVFLLRVWRPKEEWHFREERAPERETERAAAPAYHGGQSTDTGAERAGAAGGAGSYRRHSLARTLYSWSPFIILAVVVLIAFWAPVHDLLARAQLRVNFPVAQLDPESGNPVISWPGLDGEVAQAQPVVSKPTPYSASFNMNWLTAAGTLILIADIIALALLRVGPGRAVRVYGATLRQLAWAIVTIVAILALAFLLNYSAQTFTLGLALAATGASFPFFAPLIGWLGVAVTGSDTSSNALFANLQSVTANEVGISPVLAVGSNSSGGVLGKMLSPQNLAVGTGATGLTGREGDLFRACFKWSVGLVLVMSVLATLQAYVVPFMVP